MKKWVEPKSVSVPDSVRAAVGGHTLIAEQLARRGITDPEAARRFLDPSFYVPTSANDLPDMDKAVERIKRAIKSRETILVWGDFDVDGQTSTALLVSALLQHGARVRSHIPNRFNEGHGIHLPTLQSLLDGVGVVLTCDTGVAAHEAIDYANGRGVDVVVTDHHALPDRLPNGYAVVNPMRLAAGHPLRELSGVGTAYKLVEGLFGGGDDLLDLVALGLVADVMVQIDDTRYLIQRGLNVLRQNARPGLRAMLERAGINPAEVNEGHIGFDLAPRLNAMGRLSDANPAVELLTTTDEARIAVLVNQLEGLNSERKSLTQQMYQGAKAQIERDPALLSYAALVISHPGWQSGVLGIVASRLAEQYQRPVVMLTEEGDTASGSARSVQGCDITAAFKLHSGLLNRFGGHTMAAGLSLPSANLPEFQRQLSRTVREMMGSTNVTPTLEIDAFTTLPELTLDFAGEITRLAPFGNGNPPLTLAARNVRVRSQHGLGRRAEHLELSVEDESGNRQRVLWWNGADENVPEGVFDLAFTLRISTFKGRREALVEWLDARAADGDSITLADEATTLEVMNFIGQPEPADLLASALETYPDGLLWREGGATPAGADRYHLREAETLMVWTAPAWPEIWAGVMEIVKPKRLILFGVNPPFDGLEAFLRQLAGLVKYALKSKGGKVSMADVAAVTAQREETAAYGLDWLAGDGQIRIVSRDGDVVQVEQPGTASETAKKSAAQKLTTALKETQAYRDFWRGKQSWP